MLNTTLKRPQRYLCTLLMTALFGCNTEYVQDRESTNNNAETTVYVGASNNAILYYAGGKQFLLVHDGTKDNSSQTSIKIYYSNEQGVSRPDFKSMLKYKPLFILKISDGEINSSSVRSDSTYSPVEMEAIYRSIPKNVIDHVVGSQ